jgi:hypothetical protein
MTNFLLTECDICSDVIVHLTPEAIQESCNDCLDTLELFESDAFDWANDR